MGEANLAAAVSCCEVSEVLARVAGWLFTEVEVGPGQLSVADWARLAWGLLWRAGVLAALVGALALGVCAVGESLAGDSTPPLRPTLLRLASGGAAFAALPLYLRWLLRARFGTLRLALIRTAQRS